MIQIEDLPIDKDPSQGKGIDTRIQDLPQRFLKLGNGDVCGADHARILLAGRDNGGVVAPLIDRRRIAAPWVDASRSVHPPTDPFLKGPRDFGRKLNRTAVWNQKGAGLNKNPHALIRSAGRTANKEG